MIRICFLVGFASEHPVVKTLAQNIGQLLNGYFKLDIITSTVCEEYELFELYGIDNAQIAPTIIKIYWDFVKCYRYAREKKPDVLFHLVYPNIHGLIIVLVGALMKIPVVVRYNGDIFEHYKLENNIFRKIKSYLLFNMTMPIVFRFANLILPNGRILEEKLINRGIRKEKVVYLPQPLNRTQFTMVESKKDFKKLLGLPEDSQVILFVGRLTYWKGLEVMLQIMDAVLSKQMKPFFFVFVGRGPYSIQLRRLNSTYVRVVDVVPRAEIDKYYKAADLFVFPSLLEGTPNVVLEALACGTPVIARGVGEIPLLVSNICDSTDEFVKYIIEDKCVLDCFPIQFEANVLRDQYREIFTKMANGKCK